MKKFLLSIMLFLLALIFVGCSAKDSKYDDGIGENYFAAQSNVSPQAGQLTASERSDLKDYDFYLSLFESSQESPKGVFGSFYEKGYFDTLNMVDVTVKNGNTKLFGASVELLNEDQEVIYKSITNANGIAYLFPKSDELESISNITIKHTDQTVSQPYQYSTDNNTITIDIAANNTHQDVIEIMFVIDTTGSMGDEISYLITEIDFVISEAKESNPTSTIKLALLFYRDKSDSYVTKYFDFTTNINDQKSNLSKQSASGGGDFEEAVDVALDEAVSKNWSVDNTTKLLFHVLDAPPHYTQENMSKYYQAIYNASQKGIRMIPVASSGIDKYTEYLLRNEAMMTGGSYVFITDDSGIGEDHIEASVDEKVVEYLNHLLIRLINEYHTGIAGEKIPYSSNQQ